MKCKTLNICIFLLLTSIASPVAVLAVSELQQTPEQPSDGADIEARSRLFEYERAICEQFTQLVARDPEWMKRFLSLDVRQSQGLVRLLESNQYHATPTFQYLLSNLDRFVIDVDWHGTHLTQAGPIFCETGTLQLQELEARGPSAASWKARKLVLDECFDDLNWPWTEAAHGREFKDCLAELNEAKRTYRDSPWQENVRRYALHRAQTLSKTA